MVSNVTLGKGFKLFTIWSAVWYANTRKDDDPILDALRTSGGVLSTAALLNPQLTFGVTGWGVRAVLTHPVTQGVTAAVVAGALISNEIDPDSGLSNYVGFITGGEFGEEDIHYFSGDPNDSGYFNVGRNVQIIGTHYYETTKEGYKKRGRQLKKAATDTYEAYELYYEEKKRQLLQRPSWI